MIGLKRGVVKLSKYNPKWKTLFEEESALIFSAAENFIADIQHIGSTAIPEIVAKPIIDILAAINSLSNIAKIIDPLKALGFIYRGEQGIPDRHLFVLIQFCGLNTLSPACGSFAAAVRAVFRQLAAIETTCSTIPSANAFS